VHEYDLERYLTVRRAYGATLGPDGTLAFLLDTTGTAQVWTLDEPGGWPTQRTFFDEPVSFASYSPTRRELVFGMDEGGNERLQLSRLDADGQITDLTGMPDAKHRWGGWSHDGDRVAFASNRRDEAVFDVYVRGRGGEDEAELVFEGEGWLSIGGCVQWGPEGDLYLVTDEGADTLYLARMDAETGALETVQEGGEWNVDGVAVDTESGLAVYSRNVEGYTELTLADTTDGFEEVPLPDLPGDVAGGVSFGPAGERIALSASGRALNTNVFVLAASSVRQGAGTVRQWTDADTAGIPRETFVEPELVRYETFDGREIPAFFSLPREVPDGAPVVVDIHGGPESQRRPSFAGLTQYFLSRGYAVFEPNVRGSTGYGKAYTHLDDVEKRMDAVRDVDAAVDWLADHPDVDPDRIVAKGGSYGGFMVLAALTEFPDRWAAGVDSVGIANFVTFLENTGPWRRELREAEYGSLAEDRALLERISPINNIEHIEAPLFVLHGANDPRVPVGEAEQVAERARKQGVPVEKLVFEDEGHGISKLENRIEAYSRVVDFLDEHV